MSNWRLRGFVQDSDEEDEDIETQFADSTTPVQRVEDGRVESTQPSREEPKTTGQEDVLAEDRVVGLGDASSAASPRNTPPRQRFSPKRPTESPITPIAEFIRDRPITPPAALSQPRQEEEPESPDPLQLSLNNRLEPKRVLLSSQSLGPPHPSQPSPISGARVATNHTIFRELGIDLLSDLDDDLSGLSDPPSDLDQPYSYASPHRQTQARVVIAQTTPTSAAAINDIVRRSNRALRERKPIQLNPYLIEGELYRREFRERGIRPLARERSPPPKLLRPDTETQERDFDPEHSSPANTQNEIPIFSPILSGTRRNTVRRPSSGQSASKVVRRSLLDNELRIPGPIKRRRLNFLSTRADDNLRTSHERDGRLVRDVYSLPQSPPSSPTRNGVDSTARRLIRPAPTVPLIDLPTPSNSSSVQGDVQPTAVLDSDPVILSTYRSGGQLRGTVVISSDSSSPGSQSSASSSESEAEVRQVSRKIKGVLPASWLRLDRRAQEGKTTQTKQRWDDAVSPLRNEPQRGVAQRVIRRNGHQSRTPLSEDRPGEFVVISDDSDQEPDVRVAADTRDVHESANLAADIAASIDRRYADDDSDNMENDRLHLFRVQGPSRKRKTQTRLTEAFGTKKRRKLLDNGIKGLRNAKVSSTHGAGRRKRVSKGTRHTPPPPLSILDFDQSPLAREEPLFLTLAKRQARRKVDHGREGPNNKHIRLRTSHDTEDAICALRQWKSGSLKAKKNLPSPKPKNRPRYPLMERFVNQQQHDWQPPATEKTQEVGQPVSQRQVAQTAQAALGLPLFARKNPTSMIAQETYTFGTGERLGVHTRQRPQSFRVAQLEGLETDFGRTHRKAAFQRGLQRVDQQFNSRLPLDQPLENPQITRFLADDDPLLTPLRSAEAVGELLDESPPAPGTPPRPKRRFAHKKVQPKRIDVDTPAYIQPSEPAFQQTRKHGLQGLGPSGTQYPTTFGVTPLVVGTYFQSATFIGGEELARCLQTGRAGSRDLDASAGYLELELDQVTFQSGPWNDELSSRLMNVANIIWLPFQDATMEEGSPILAAALGQSSRFLRSLINYCSTRLSFLDVIDRQGFFSKMKQFIQSMFDRLFGVHSTQYPSGSSASTHARKSIRTWTYLLVLSFQVRQIVQHPVVDPSSQHDLASIMKSISRIIVAYLVRKGTSELSDFLEKNKHYQERENGIKDGEILVESMVVCMHVLQTATIPGSTFWDFASQELSAQIEGATQVRSYESTWTSVFTLLPFTEFDDTGIAVVNRRSSFESDTWMFARDMLKQLFVLHEGTSKTHSSSLNEYIRANLTRCHVLIQYWHWRRCDQMLSTVFDFYGKLGLQDLPRELTQKSAEFLERIAEQPLLQIQPSDSSFHIFLKCLALGLQSMGHVYPEKKIRSIVFRLTPNHGRFYPKDHTLVLDSLDALRNHHDLLCTLYWASPPSCRPKLSLIRGLAHHESSHRSACGLNVRAWANLTTFQLSADEPYAALEPFAHWHNEIMQQTLKQYRLAKTEADEYLESGQGNSTSDAAGRLVWLYMEKNQEQVIGALRDCIGGMQRAIKHSVNHSLLRQYLRDCGIVRLLELAHIDDPRLRTVIRETMTVLRGYAGLQNKSSSQSVSQTTNEESQDYGDFPDLEDLDHLGQATSAPQPKQPTLEFIQNPLWHLLSNAFGAEQSPDDNLLMECIDTWVLIASCQVTSREHTWSHYLDSFSPVSWHQLRHTEQTRKFGPYFMAALINCDRVVYEEHGQEFITALLLSLADRESVLRFQHRLLAAIIRIDPTHPLMKNLPFFQDSKTGRLDISLDTLRTRRLSLLSSIMANMRDYVHEKIFDAPGLVAETRRAYSTMLKEYMTRMKTNYLQLRQGETVTGAYVEFVQQNVQFLKQYTSDICAVLPFFTDSVAFPLPATDPTYVVGRLCGYAPKLKLAGTIKQLSVFVQTVAQQAAADNQQPYLVNQLETVLCGGETPSVDRTALRTVLLQGIFPAYIEAAFRSATGAVIAMPLLQSLTSILEAMFSDLRIMDSSSVQCMAQTVSSVALAFINSTEVLKTNTDFLKRPHILGATTLMLDAMVHVLPVLEYIIRRTSTTATKHPVVSYLEDFSVCIAETVDGRVPHAIPHFDGTLPIRHEYVDLLASAKKDLGTCMRTNWSEDADRLFFGHGHARKEVKPELGTAGEEKARLVDAMERLQGAVAVVFEDDDRGGVVTGRGREFRDDVFV
ncbi:Mus7/MMS22 family-domain-containing protein [Massariosphaeria phaeospora]|uniref:Mus7/MMS22 family-domain-containing protein n=1 Tax=Massariosphaeria phaeospora TaxID=100035 RepID=A0A7C8M2K1_9PLEO|nr:Mus7/MMS22 family-domain-containing protein [Massariosphaeria phaeospora]